MEKSTLRNVLTATVVAVVIMIGFAVLVDKDNRGLREQVRTLQATLAESQVPIQRDTIRDSVEVVRQPMVTIDKTDYKQVAADRQLIKDLEMKVSLLEMENRTLIATHGEVVFKTTADSDSVLRYKDKWADFTYKVKQKELKYTVRDSLDILVSRIPKHRFLWWRWGTKGYELTTVNFNPHATVVNSHTFKISN